MSNVFNKAIEIAKSRAAWEAEVNPNGEAIVFNRLSEEQLGRCQILTDDFIEEMGAAARKTGFKTVEQAKTALAALDYETQYHPLWKMCELCIPVNSDTAVLAQAIAPVRVATVGRIREGKFGEADPVAPSAERVLVHHAKRREPECEPTRGEAARALQAKRAAVQTNAFQALAGALGGSVAGVKGEAKARKGLEAVVRDLDGKLGGVRVVDGELRKVSAKGQMKLFDEETAPIPKAAEAEKKRKPKVGK